MNKFELWTIDEYGQGTIVQRSEDINDLVNTAKEEVNDANVNNALTAEEKIKNWTSYFVEVIDDDGSVIDDVFYSGNRPDGKHRVFVLKNSKVLKEELNGQYKIRFYLGDLGNKSGSKYWYAEHIGGKLVTDIQDQILDDKVMYFIKLLD